MRKNKLVTLAVAVFLVLALGGLLSIAACGGPSATTTPATTSPTKMPTASPTTTSPAKTPTTTTATTKPAGGTYSAAECKLLTADDIASVLGMAAADVSEEPVQKTEGQCIESWTVRKGGAPVAGIAVLVIETRANPYYKAGDPKDHLAALCKDSKSLGIGDCASCEFTGAIWFGKGKYMVQVACPMGCSIEQTIALAKLVAKHM